MNSQSSIMKKVLLTINNNRLSGIEKFTFLLAKYLNKNEYRVEIGMPTFGPICALFEKNNIDFFIFNNKTNGRYTASGILFLFKYIYRKKYDIIHAQAGIAPCLIGKIFGTKLIIEHKHGLDFTSEQIDRMGFMKLNYERIKKYLVNRTFTGCKADKMVLIRRFKYKDENVDVIYNGIENDGDIFEIIKNKKFTIGTIGRLTYQKGQEYFIEAARILVSKGYDFQFLIYGEGEKYNEYKDMIRKYQLEKTVYLMGYAKKIPQVMRSFDLFVLSSRYEGIPYVILEAMKASVPVITTDVGGINEVITSMANGILINKEDPEEIARNIILLYDSNKLRNDITENAKKDFYEKYTIDKTIASIESVYSSCS